MPAAGYFFVTRFGNYLVIGILPAFSLYFAKCSTSALYLTAFKRIMKNYRFLCELCVSNEPWAAGRMGGEKFQEMAYYPVTAAS